MTTRSDDPRLRPFSLPGHVLAWVLILIPISGVVLAVMLPGEEVARRIRVAAQLIDAMPFPTLGLTLGTLLAAYFGQRVLSHLYAVVSVLLGATTLLMGPFFLLDSLQIRGAVELRRIYDLNVARGVIEHVLYGGLLLLLAVTTWRTLRINRAPTASNLVSPPGPGLPPKSVRSRPQAGEPGR